MGFWGSIGRCISGVCHAVCSVVSGACKAIGNFASAAIKTLGKVGGMIGSLATKLCGFIDAICIAALGPVLGPIVAMLIKQSIADAIADLAKKLLTIEDKPEEVGYRVEEAANHPEWDKPDNPRFKNFEEYYAYLKEMIPDSAIDREKLEAHKLEYTMTGIATEAVAIGEKKGIALGADFLEIIGLGKISATEINVFMDVFKELGYDRVALKEYLDGTMKKEERVRVGSVLRETLKTVMPEGKVNGYLNILREVASSDVNVASQKAYELVYKTAADDLKAKEDKSQYFDVMLTDAERKPYIK